MPGLKSKSERRRAAAESQREFGRHVYGAVKRFRSIEERPQFTRVGDLTEKESWLYDTIVGAFESFRYR